MKKQLICLLLAAPVSIFAQFKVSSNGTALLGSSTFNLTESTKNLEVYSNRTVSTYNIGVMSTALMNSNIGKSAGVFGIGGNATQGYNFGVIGMLAGSKNGCGILGTIGYDQYSAIGGMYAGYFNGPVYTTGTLTASSVTTPSDMRLKTNVTSVSYSSDTESFLKKISNLDVIEYNYNDKVLPIREDTKESLPKEVQESYDRIIGKRHYGLSAQELKEAFPLLVDEGQNGYLTVNYLEMIPVLIKTIQELKQELDEVRGTRGMTRSTTGIDDSVSSQNVLYQNSPNPFNEATTIRFKLSTDVRDASICIFDMSGKMLKKIAITSDQESVSVNGYELGEGLYLYSLIVNGQEINTKKMVITK